MITTLPDEKAVWETLRQIIDPELDCNLVDLGLIYDVKIEGAKVLVKMTLTTPGCPMQESIAAGVNHALLGLPGVEEVKVQIVWEPMWTPARMSDAGRVKLGIHGA